MIVRKATSADSGSLEDIINTAYLVEAFFVAGNRIHPNEIEAYLKKGFFLVTEEEGKILGCIYVEVKKERAYFGLLSIHPTHQGKGLAKKLVLAAENLARERLCRYMDIHIVNLREELPAFYHKLGYQETGETGPFAPRELVTEKTVYFIMMSKVL
jgi:N-acetylglutamate synthase-like GNAT family acetyltransferase